MQGTKYVPGSTAAQSLTEATTGTGLVKALNDCRQVYWVVTGNGTISNGTVVIESSNVQDYAGTWNELDSVDLTTLTGDEKYVNTFPTSGGGFVRPRITEDVEGGGSCSVEVNGLFQ
jgi:hypothetical protein